PSAKAFRAGAGRQRPSGRPGLAEFTILPDGKRLLLESGGDLWIYDVPAASALRLTSKPEAERNAAPSPDARRVAFVRGFALGVVDAEGGSPRWVELPQAKDGYIARVDWTPKSDAVLVQVLDRAQDRLTLLSVDPATGKAAVVFEETSPAWIDVNHDLRVLRDGRILWRSARSGFEHLSLYAPATHAWTQVTTGAWNVDAVEGVDEDAGIVFFSG